MPEAPINPIEVYESGMLLPENDGAVVRMRKSLEGITFTSENVKQDSRRIFQSIANQLQKKYNPDPKIQDVVVSITHRGFKEIMPREDAINLESGLLKMSNNATVKRISVQSSNVFKPESSVYAIQASLTAQNSQNQIVSEISVTYIVESFEDENDGGIVRVFIRKLR